MQLWPVCHVRDNSTLYLELLRNILARDDVGYGKRGFYLASPGSVAWDDIYGAMATALAKRGVVDDDKIAEAKDDDLEKMGEALGCPKEVVAVQVGGK